MIVGAEEVGAVLEQLTKAAFGRPLRPGIEVSFERAMLEPVAAVKWVLKVLPGIIEVHLIAAQKLHIRTRGGRQVHVGSSHCAVRIFAPEETGTEHHDERRIRWSRQPPRNRLDAGVGLPLATDAQR